MLTLFISLSGIIIWMIAIVFRYPVPLINKAAHLALYILLGYLFFSPKIKEQFK